MKISAKLASMIGIFFLVLLASFSPRAQAEVLIDELPGNQSYNDFVVGPGKIDAELAPGESQTFELTVSNRLGSEKTFNLSEEDFVGTSNPEQTIVLLGDDRGPYSLRDYVKLATTSISIPQSRRAHIPVTISIPADAQPGGLYGSVIIGTATAQGAGSASSGAKPTAPIVTRIGMLFFVRVKGPVKESGSLDRFLLAGNKKVLFGSDTIVFDLLFKNEGNVHLNPYGTITVKNIMGSTVGNLQVDPWFAMPASLRFREVEWRTPFLMGRYEASASISRGYGDYKDEATIVFWVIPWKVILLALAGLAVIIAFFKFILSKFSIVRK